ncbi:MAG: hypothetical protein PHP02_03110 [Eubacteriales bacterium]|nr:hypothetical protein [Eubacteriales bacterium]
MRLFGNKRLTRRAMLFPLLFIVLAVTACSNQGFAIRIPGSFASSLSTYHFSQGGLVEIESVTSVNIGLPVWYKVEVKGIQPGYTVLTFTYEDNSAFSAILNVDDKLNVTSKEKAFDLDSRLEDSGLTVFQRIRQWLFNMAYQSIFAFYLVGTLLLLLIVLVLWVLIVMIGIIAKALSFSRS